MKKKKEEEKEKEKEKEIKENIQFNYLTNIKFHY
jgi:hypothetical protein